MATLEITRQFVDEMIDHARQDAPNECCGVLLGQDGQVIAIRRVTNAEASPFRYNMDPREFYTIYKESEERSWEMWGFYHSHTHTQAFPSQTDRNLAAWQDSYYLIVSLENEAAPIIRAFSITDEDVEEHEIHVTEAPARDPA